MISNMQTGYQHSGGVASTMRSWQNRWKPMPEISEVIEKVDNLIKVTEDIYYARRVCHGLKSSQK